MVEKELPRTEVMIPEDQELAAEPARWVAKSMKWRTAIVGILAAMGVILAPELIENIDTLIQAVIIVGFGLYELWQNHRQGEQTRAKVYSPLTAARLASPSNVAETAPPTPEDATWDP